MNTTNGLRMKALKIIRSDTLHGRLESGLIWDDMTFQEMKKLIKQYKFKKAIELFTEIL